MKLKSFGEPPDVSAAEEMKLKAIGVEAREAMELNHGLTLAAGEYLDYATNVVTVQNDAGQSVPVRIFEQDMSKMMEAFQRGDYRRRVLWI